MKKSTNTNLPLHKRIATGQKVGKQALTSGKIKK